MTAVRRGSGIVALFSAAGGSEANPASSCFSESFRSCRVVSSRCILASWDFWCGYSIRLVGRFEMRARLKILHRGHRGKAEKNLRRIKAITAEGAEETTPCNRAAEVFPGRGGG